MQGHIRKRGKGSWTIVFDGPRGEDGRRKQVWKSVKGTKKDAEKELAKHLNEVHTGSFVDPSTVTIAQFFEHWLQYKKNGMTAGAYEEYERIVRRDIIPSLGRHCLQKLKPIHIQNYYNRSVRTKKELGVTDTVYVTASGKSYHREGCPLISKSRIAMSLAEAEEKGYRPCSHENGNGAQMVLHIHQVLRSALGDAVRWQIMPMNPATAARPPRVVKREMQILSLGEVRNLIPATKETDYYIAMLIAVSTGMRRSEVLALRWEDVDFEAGTLTVCRTIHCGRGGVVTFKEPKTERSCRTISVSPSVMEVLRAHRANQLKKEGREDSGLVCSRKDGKAILPDTFTHAAVRLMKSAGVQGVRLHDLRHTQVALMRLVKADLKSISDRLGHSNISTTADMYGHMLEKLDREAANKMDGLFRESEASD